MRMALLFWLIQPILSDSRLYLLTVFRVVLLALLPGMQPWMMICVYLSDSRPHLNTPKLVALKANPDVHVSLS